MIGSRIYVKIITNMSYIINTYMCTLHTHTHIYEGKHYVIFSFYIIIKFVACQLHALHFYE